MEYHPLHFTRALRADKKVPGLLYAGTEYGMFISYNDGENWQPFQLNLPIVSITDLAIKNNDLVVATQGRALWILDDLSMVQQKQQFNPAKNFQVMPVAESYRMEGNKGSNVTNAGNNPENGVVLNYYVKNVADSPKVAITFFDKQHKEVRTFSTTAKDSTEKIEVNKGMNRFVWNMQYPAAEKIDGMILWNTIDAGPKVAPGNYVARVKVNNDSVDVPFVIKGDPNYKMTEAQYDEQVGFLLKSRDKFSEVQKAIKDIRSLRSQVKDFTGKIDSVEYKEIKVLSDSITNRLTRVEEALYQTKAKSGQDILNYPIRINDKIAGMFEYASSGYSIPSEQVKLLYDELSAEAGQYLAALKQIREVDIKKLNELIYQQRIPVIAVKE